MSAFYSILIYTSSFLITKTSFIISFMKPNSFLPCCNYSRLSNLSISWKLLTRSQVLEANLNQVAIEWLITFSFYSFMNLKMWSFNCYTFLAKFRDVLLIYKFRSNPWLEYALGSINTFSYFILRKRWEFYYIVPISVRLS